MTGGYFYDRSGEPIGRWTWMQKTCDRAYSRIARTTVMSAADPTVAYDVSTIWLGVDYSFGEGVPVIFETMVFGDGRLDLTGDRYPTEASARRGHEEMVTVVAATVEDPVLMDAASEDAPWVSQRAKEQQPMSNEELPPRVQDSIKRREFRQSMEDTGLTPEQAELDAADPDFMAAALDAARILEEGQ